MKFYDIKNILKQLFEPSGYVLPHRVDNYEGSMKDSYGYNRSVVTQYFVITNWTYQQKVVKFIQEIQWLKVQTSVEFNKIIAKNASNDKNEILLSKNEFDKVNNWFTDARKAYNNMLPLINEISYVGLNIQLCYLLHTLKMDLPTSLLAVIIH